MAPCVEEVGDTTRLCDFVGVVAVSLLPRRDAHASEDRPSTSPRVPAKKTAEGSTSRSG